MAWEAAAAVTISIVVSTTATTNISQLLASVLGKVRVVGLCLQRVAAQCGRQRSVTCGYGVWGRLLGVVGCGLLPRKPVPETMTWFHSIFRLLRAAVLLVQWCPWLFALGIAVHNVPLLHPKQTLGLARPARQV